MLPAAEARVLDVAVAWPGASKRSSTLHRGSRGCAEPALQNIARNFCGIEGLAHWTPALTVRPLLLPPLPRAGCDDPSDAHMS